MIGYYIHHHGHGHRTRAASICARTSEPVTALCSAPLGRFADVFADVVELPRDDESVDTAEDPTAGGLLHWVPRHDRGLRERMAALASWVATARPRLLVVDVSVEVAVFARLLGVPVVVVAMPGERTDTPHRLGYRAAEHIVAPWPREVYEPAYLRPYAEKTTYVGGISRFDGRPVAGPAPGGRPRVLVLSGSGGSSLSAERLHELAERHPGYAWDGVGVPGGPWVDDPWSDLSRADVVVGHAGQNSVADIAAARRPAIVVAEPRPYDEQCATADALGRAGLAVTLPAWPHPDDWSKLLRRALRLDPAQWSRWRTEGAAGRAAAVLDEVAAKVAPR